MWVIHGLVAHISLSYLYNTIIYLIITVPSRSSNLSTASGYSGWLHNHWFTFRPWLRLLKCNSYLRIRLAWTSHWVWLCVCSFFGCDLFSIVGGFLASTDMDGTAGLACIVSSSFTGSEPLIYSNPITSSVAIGRTGLICLRLRRYSRLFTTTAYDRSSYIFFTTPLNHSDSRQSSLTKISLANSSIFGNISLDFRSQFQRRHRNITLTDLSLVRTATNFIRSVSPLQQTLVNIPLLTPWNILCWPTEYAIFRTGSIDLVY
jgi:hypothetical protein